MQKEKLGLHHKELLFPRLRGVSIPISEYSFPNLYLFRHKHEYEVLIDGDHVFITGTTYDGLRYIMPTHDCRNVDCGYLRSLLSDYDMLFPLAEEWLGYLPADEFDISYNDGDSDYIYTIEKLSSYRGKKLHAKRNLLKQFKELYHHESLPLTNERLADAREVLDAWQRDSGSDPADTDYHACGEALELYEELVLCGGIYYVDGEPAGFVIGEELNDEVFALHFVKGKKKFKGLYQFMYNNFAGIMPAKYRYFNFEQDLGLDTLRLAKSSYYPELMLKKYRARNRSRM